MAHMIETMAYAGETPWHGLGVKVDEAVCNDPKRMIVQAGLDWQVEKAPLMTADTNVLVDRFATRRVSDGAILGTVGGRYEVVQNEQAFEWFAPFVESGEASFHTAGSLAGGARVWVLAKLNRDPLVIKGDDAVEKFLLLSHGHDGTQAVRVGFTPIRVVCQNTLSMAHSNAGSSLLRLRHTKTVHANLANVRETVNTINAAFEATAEQYRKLAHKDINDNDVARYVRVVFGFEEVGKLSAKADAIIDDVMNRIAAGAGNEGNTWWDAYNGVTEHLSHKRGRSNDTRLQSLWFGEAASMNKLALDSALELAAA